MSGGFLIQATGQILSFLGSIMSINSISILLVSTLLYPDSALVLCLRSMYYHRHTHLYENDHRGLVGVLTCVLVSHFFVSNGLCLALKCLIPTPELSNDL